MLASALLELHKNHSSQRLRKNFATWRDSSFKDTEFITISPIRMTISSFFKQPVITFCNYVGSGEFVLRNNVHLIQMRVDHHR